MAAKTADAVDEAWYQISPSPSFTRAPRFVTALGAHYAADNAHFRYRRNTLTTTDVQVMVETCQVFENLTGLFRLPARDAPQERSERL